MYAVVNTGGKQYKVQQGEILRVEKIPGDVGSPVTFDRVLMFSDGETVSIGQPVLDNVAVEGHIVEQGKAKKIIVFKYKRRKRYRRKQGHRQAFTAVHIDSIATKAARAKKETPEKADAPKPEAKTEAPEKAEAKKAAPKKAEAKKSAPKKAPAKKVSAKKAARETSKPAEADAPEAVPEEKDQTE